MFIPLGLYHFTRHQLTYGSAKDRRFTFNLFERFGGYYGGTLNEFRVRMNYRATTKFSVSASSTWDRFRLPLPNGNFSIVLASVQANCSFNRFLTFTSVIQLDTSNTQAVSANVRLRYNYRPDMRSLCNFQRGHAIHKYSSVKSTTGARNQVRCEVDLFLSPMNIVKLEPRSSAFIAR